MTGDVDLVVVGRLVNAAPGGTVVAPEGGGLSHLSATVTIDEVLKGTPESLIPGEIHLRFILPNADDTEAIIESVPTERQLLFLVNLGAAAARHGQPPVAQEEGRYTYYLPNFQAVLLDSAGLAKRPPVPVEDANDFPAALEGEAFEALLERVRTTADG